MLVLLLTFLAIFLFWLIFLQFSKRFFVWERLSIAIFLGIFFLNWVIFLAAWAFGYSISYGISFFLLIVGIFWIGRKLVLKKSLLGLDSPKNSQPSPNWLTWALVTWPALSVIGIIFSHQYLSSGLGGLYSGGSTWGDLAMHLSLISHFTVNQKVVWNFSLLDHASLTYPFMIDFYTSLLWRTGLSLRAALLWPSFLLLFSLIQLFYFMVWRFFKSNSATVIAFYTFFLAGSFYGQFNFWSVWKNSGQSLIQFVGSLPTDFSNLPEKGLNFASFIGNLLLPERGFLFAMPLFFLVLIIWQMDYEYNLSWGWFALVGVLIGLTPLTHDHTFIILITLSFLLMLWRRREHQKWLLSFILTVGLAWPQFYWQMSKNFSNHFSSFYFGWMRESGENFFVFWWQNWGPIFIILFLTSAYFLFKKQKNIFEKIFLILMLFFLATNVYIFQPNNFDNIKLLIYVYLGVTLALAYYLSLIWRFWWGRWVIVLGVCLLSFTGIFSLIRQFQMSYLFMSNDSYAFAQKVDQIVPVSDLVVTNGSHDNPIPVLTGRNILSGYDGWLYSYGLNYTKYQTAASDIFAGIKPQTLIKQNGIKYLAAGPSDSLVVEPEYQLIAETNGWRLFQVQ